MRKIFPIDFDQQKKMQQMELGKRHELKNVMLMPILRKLLIDSFPIKINM
jgi:hypothetical protein